MPKILCYTLPGIGTYPDHNYPGHVALNCDWEHSVHLAYSMDGEGWTPLNNNTGVLFARAAYDEGRVEGTTKTLVDPWLARDRDSSFLLAAVRRNQNAPDTRHVGCAMLFRSNDLIRYEELGFLKLADGEIRKPRFAYDAEKDAYRFSWEIDAGRFEGLTRDLVTIEDARPTDALFIENVYRGIEGGVPGNTVEVTDDELKVILGALGEIECVGVEPITLEVVAGERPAALPKVTCVYSDGSTHEKAVDWETSTVDWEKPGVYRAKGRARVKSWPFPIPLNFGVYAVDALVDPNMLRGMSDPCVTEYRGKYYLSSSGTQNIALRCADTIEGTFSAEPRVIHRVPLKEGEAFTGTWAAELHEIDGTLYLFTAICPGGEWTRVKAAVLRCTGDPLDEGAWEAPRLCVKMDGSVLTEGGISLDMTYFRDGGRDYVMWSDRKIHYGTEPLEIEPADIYIATIDPNAPWQLTSAPVCVIRPTYGWDRYETEVVEGPYLLRHDGRLFVTISGSSTGMGDLYDVGLLIANEGDDLLEPSSWTYWPYPLLTKESVPGEYGPGHNNFVVDPETGDALMIYHAIPHDENDRTLHRQPAIRRVHWARNGLPYLRMTPERDMPEGMRDAEMTVRVRGN